MEFRPNEKVAKSATLVRRIIENQEKPRLPKSEQDRIDNDNAVKMITLVACLNYAMVDLGSDLEDAGLMKQNIKRNYNIAYRKVVDIHRAFDTMVSKVNKLAGKRYMYLMDKNDQAIHEHIYLQGVERSYNVVMALCRLINIYYNKIRGRYLYRPLVGIDYVMNMLNFPDIPKHDLDFIIDKAVSIE